MFANHSVNEPRPPKDQDSPMSFTMEGYQGVPPESTTSFYWSPGWNSAQAITKFRNEIAFGRSEQQAGVRLLEPAKGQFNHLNGTTDKESKVWTAIPIHHIFGSEELSIKSAALQARGPEAFVVLNQAQAAQLGIKAGDDVNVLINGEPVSLKVTVEADWPQDCLGISAGFPGVPYLDHQSNVQPKPKGHES